ncbi:MAG: DNA polymerase I [Dehalococcoidia bacterium]|nr:DNA polymerase I [Dehalococcoidia bacterium]
MAARTPEGQAGLFAAESADAAQPDTIGADQPEGAADVAVEEREPLLLLLDGHAMAFRAFFAMEKTPMTTRSMGERVEAVHSFAGTLFRAIGDLRPTHVAIAFDPPGPTFRDELYADYKAHRPPTPEELNKQVERVKQLMRALDVPIYETPGYEADDVIGTIAAECSAKGVDTVIFTGDSDTFQLVTPHVRVLMTTGFGDQKTYDVEAVRERYGGLEPLRQIDVKAFEGDTSDNVPGVPGVGRKTAVKLVQEFGSVEAVYERIDEVKPPRIQGLLREHEEQARRSKELVTIVTDAPAGFDLTQAAFGGFKREAVVELFRELEFNSLIARIPAPGGAPAEQAGAAAGAPEPDASSIGAPDTQATVVDSAEALAAMADAVRAAGVMSLVVEGSPPAPMLMEIAGIAVAAEPGKAWYVPVGHAEGAQAPIEETLGALLPLLTDAAVAKVGHNLNHELTALARHGLEPTRAEVEFDTMIAAQLLGRDRALGLPQVALHRLGLEMTPLADLIGSGRKQIPFGQVSVADAATYAGAKADAALRLRDYFTTELDARSMEVLRTLEMPLVPVLVRMQLHGIALDADAMRELNEELTEMVRAEEQAVYEAAGHEFNISSPQQLSDVLFKEQGLPHGKRTQTGYSTDAQTLEWLRDHPVVDHVLRYRELSKLKSTYVDTLPQQVNPATGRIHTTYNQAGAATGRLASNDPNLQNIPIRTELGRRVRKAFVAEGRPAWMLLAADYSQVELRVLAHLSEDPELIAAFERGEDIHASTAALVNRVPIAEVTPDMRRVAKVMNFGVIYGLSAFGISNQTELSMEEGNQFIETYMGAYPRVKEYLDGTIRQAREQGYVETMLGRRRPIPDINASNRNVRQAAERMAVNMPVQGTAADIIKEAMAQVQARLEKDGMRSRMLLQVHDELVFETPLEEEAGLSALLEEIMPYAGRLTVPLRIDIKKGYSWGDME